MCTYIYIYICRERERDREIERERETLVYLSIYLFICLSLFASVTPADPKKDPYEYGVCLFAMPLERFVAVWFVCFTPHFEHVSKFVEC